MRTGKAHSETGGAGGVPRAAGFPDHPQELQPLVDLQPVALTAVRAAAAISIAQKNLRIGTILGREKNTSPPGRRPHLGKCETYR